MLYTIAAFLCGCALSLINFSITKRRLKKDIKNINTLYMIHMLLIILLAGAVGVIAAVLKQGALRPVAAAVVGATAPETVMTVIAAKKGKI